MRSWNWIPGVSVGELVFGSVAEMEVFAQVVERSGFSAAARALDMTPSAVSKLVARLEARLGARLINRSTRRLQLTPEGAVFYERCVRVLADIEEAEREAAAGTAPRGRVRRPGVGLARLAWFHVGPDSTRAWVPSTRPTRTGCACSRSTC